MLPARRLGPGIVSHSDAEGLAGLRLPRSRIPNSWPSVSPQPPAIHSLRFRVVHPFVRLQTRGNRDPVLVFSSSLNPGDVQPIKDSGADAS